MVFTEIQKFILLATKKMEDFRSALSRQAVQIAFWVVTHNIFGIPATL